MYTRDFDDVFEKLPEIVAPMITLLDQNITIIKKSFWHKHDTLEKDSNMFKLKMKVQQFFSDQLQRQLYTQNEERLKKHYKLQNKSMESILDDKLTPLTYKRIFNNLKQMEMSQENSESSGSGDKSGSAGG